MQIDILSVFPEMFAPLYASIPARAQSKGLVSVRLHNLRNYGSGVHRQLDDVPFGGGPGMVMQAPPLARAITEVKEEFRSCHAGRSPKVLFMSPQGTPFSQKDAERFAREEGLVLLCGHYEGIDERIIENYVDEEVSLGDYVLSGGELAAMVISDAVIRLLEGAIDHESAAQESFSTTILDHPHYSRPAEFEGHGVPEVLLSGDHARICAWRREAALKATLKKRPDLLEKASEAGLLSPQEIKKINSWKANT